VIVLFRPFEMLLSSAGTVDGAPVVVGAVFSLVEVASVVSGIVVIGNEAKGEEDTAADAMGAVVVHCTGR
jgi:hypothetical protein